MSGMKITDRKFFAGSGSPQFPKGVHTKMESSADSAGELSKYEDTSEAIRASQEANKKKVKAYSQKSDHRN